MNTTDNPSARQPAEASFASQLRGPHARPFDITIAKINADIYLPRGTTIDGWSPLDDEQLRRAGIPPGMLQNDRIGFRARVYGDQQGHYVLAFCGTNEGKDWIHNLRQGIGLEDRQYEMAVDLARRARAAFGENMVMTGHSLGGGLATAGAVATDTPAVTFNAAGLHDNTLERLNFNPDPVRQELEQGNLIRRYAVDHEILTTLQERSLLTRGLLPDAVGRKIELPDPNPIHGWKTLIPGSSLKHGLELHGMDSVIEAQQQAARGLLTNAAHPLNGMFNQALDGLKGLQPDTLGFSREGEYRNAAGSLAAKAHGSGMQRIDHVVHGTNGALFAVEGPLQDASHRIVSVEKAPAAAQSIEASSTQVRQQMEAAASHPQPAETQRRTALTP